MWPWCHHVFERLDPEGGGCVCWQTGALKIFDRKKHIFKLSQGEYLAPEKIENIYVRSALVEQAFVDGRSVEVRSPPPPPRRRGQSTAPTPTPALSSSRPSSRSVHRPHPRSRRADLRRRPQRRSYSDTTALRLQQPLPQVACVDALSACVCSLTVVAVLSAVRHRRDRAGRAGRAQVGGGARAGGA